MATSPIEILCATFHNDNVTKKMQSLLQDPRYANNESFNFTPNAPLLGVDPLPGSIKPFIMTWRLKQSNQTLHVEGKPDLPISAKSRTIRVAEWTPINIVFSSASTEADMALQTFSGWCVLDVSSWITDAMAVCQAKKGHWILNRAVFPGEDPAPGVKKTLSVTFARSIGKQGPDSALVVPGIYLEGETVDLDLGFKNQPVDPAETNQLQQSMQQNDNGVDTRRQLVSCGFNPVHWLSRVQVGF